MNKPYKEKYEVSWCSLCNCATITCPVCKNSSCNGGGCNECIKDFIEWGARSVSVEDYLTDSERDIYDKTERIKSFILATMADSPKIDFTELQKSGSLSGNDEELFYDLINHEYPCPAAGNT